MNDINQSFAWSDLLPEDLRLRAVFYKADFRSMFGWKERTAERRVSGQEFPKPDFYDGSKAAWTRATVMAWVRSKMKNHPGQLEGIRRAKAV